MPDNKNKLPNFLDPTQSPVKSTAAKEFVIQSDKDRDLLPGLDQEQARARHQGFAAELGNGIAGAALKIPGNVISNLAAIADIEDYYNQDNEIGNVITNFIQDKINPVIDEEFQVHQESDKPLNLGSREWWIKNGTSLAGSATEYALTGEIVGAALSPLALLGPVGGAAATGLNALALNQAEAITSAREVYKNAYALNIKKGVGEEEAKQLAADAAAYTININRLNLPLNLSSASLFTKTAASTRKLIKEATKLGGLKRLGEEGLQEAGEEVINYVGEQEGNRRGKGEKYSVGNTIRDIFSEQGIESALLGAVGGIAQTGATEVANNFNNINKDHNERYKAQQARLAELDELNVAHGGQKLKDVLDNVEINANFMNKIYEAEANHNDGEAENLKMQHLQYQALKSFTTGTTDKLESLFEGIKNKPGVSGEEIVKANEAVQKIRGWEKIYNESMTSYSKDRVPHAFNARLESDRLFEEVNALETAKNLLTVQKNNKDSKGIPTTDEAIKLGKIDAQLTIANEKIEKVANDFKEILDENFNASEYSKKKLAELKGEDTEVASTEETIPPVEGEAPVVEEFVKTTKTEPTVKTKVEPVIDEEAEYEEFKKTGKVSESTLDKIANKGVAQEPLTDIEKEYAKANAKVVQRKMDEIQGFEPEEEFAEDDIKSLEGKTLFYPSGEYTGIYKIKNGKVVGVGAKHPKTGYIKNEATRNKVVAEAKKQADELNKLAVNQLKNLTEGKEAGEATKKEEKKETKATTKKTKETKVEKIIVGQPPIMPPTKGEEVEPFDNSVQGGDTLAKTAGTKVQDIPSNKPSNRRWQEFVDTFEQSGLNPKMLAFKVVTSNDAEYDSLLDPAEKTEVERKIKSGEIPKGTVFVKYLLVDKETKTPILDSEGNTLVTVPLKNEKVNDGKDFAISPKHFLSSKGKKNPELGTNHSEWNTLWEEEVAKKDAFRAALESGKIAYVNVESVSPGHIITKEGGKEIPYISPAQALWTKEDEKEVENGVVGKVKLFIPTTPHTEGKELQNYQLVDSGTDIDEVTGKAPFKDLGKTKKKLQLGSLYAFVNGAFFKLQARKLLQHEVVTVSNLFSRLSTETSAKGIEYRLHMIDNYIYLNKDKVVGPHNIFLGEDNRTVYFGNSTIDIEDIGADVEATEKFNNFLKERYRQVDTMLVKSNRQIPTVNERGQVDTEKTQSYYEFIFGGKDPAFTIQMKPLGERQRENRYMTVDSSKPVSKTFAEPVQEKKAVASEIKSQESKVVKVYHHTSVKPEDFNFTNFKKDKWIGQFGNGVYSSTETNDLLVSRYGNPIEGEVKHEEFIPIDAESRTVDVYNDLVKQGYKFKEVYDDTETLEQSPGAARDLFDDFQESNPDVKGVLISNHKVGPKAEVIPPFYVVYDAKSFYGSGSLSKNGIVSESKTIEAKEEVSDVTPPLITEEVKKEIDTSKVGRFKKKDTNLNYRLAGNKKNYKKENIAAAKAWYTKQFGDTDIEVTKKLIDGKAFGQFFKDVVYIWENAEEGTLFHEAFHKVTRQYLTKEQVDSLYSEYRKSVGNDKLTDREVEEALAEGFREYMLNGQKSINGKPVQNTIFRKLWRMIKSFVTDKKDIQGIYEKLAGKGYSKDRKIASFKSKLNRPFKGLSETETMEFNNRTTFMMFDALFLNGKTPIELRESKYGGKLVSDAYDVVFNKYSEHYDKAVLEGNEDLEKQLETILEDWNDYVDQHTETINNLIQVKNGAAAIEVEKTLEDAVDEYTGLDIEESKGDSRGEHQAVNEVNPIVMSANNTRILLATLVEKTKDSNGNIVDVLDEAGFKKPAKFNEMYKLLINELKGIEGKEDMYRKLESLVDIYPTIQSLLDRLGNSEDIATANFNTGRVWMDFWQDMNNFESTGVLTMLGENGNIYQVPANRHNLEGRIKDEWRAKLKLSPYADNTGAEVTLTEDVLDLPAGGEDNFERVKKDIDFYEAIGIEFDGYSDEELASEFNPDGSRNTSFLKTELRTNIEKHIKMMLKEGKAVNDLTKIGAPSDVNKLLEIVADKSKLVIEHSYINAEDKSIHTIQKNNFYSKRINAINNAKSFQELVAKYPEFGSVNMQGSVWMKELFGQEDGSLGAKNGRLTMALNTVAGIKSEYDDTGLIITEAGTDAKFVQEFENLFSTGMVAIPRSADGTLEQTGGVFKSKDRALVISLDSIARNGFNSKKVKEVFEGYFLAELQRIRDFNIKGLGKDIEIYNKNANKWTIFEDILSESTKKLISSEDAEGKSYLNTESKVPQAILNKVIKDVETFFENQSVGKSKYPFGSTLEQMNKQGLIRGKKIVGISKDLTAKNSVEDLARAYTINHFIQTVEHHKVFLGDKAFFKDIFKRTKGGSGTKKYCNNDATTNEWINNPIMKKFNSALEYAVGKTYKALVVEDVMVESELFADYVNAVDSREGASELADEVRELAEQKMGEYGFDSEKNKGKMTEADAQGLSNLVFHRHMMLKASKWGIKQEEKYDYEMKHMFIRLHERAVEENSKEKYGRDLSSYILDETTLAKYREETKVIPEGIINIQKGQYFGPQNYKGLNATTFHKYSIAPMYWRLVEGTNLEDKFLDMLENQVGYMVFSSGVKLGARQNASGKLSPFYDSEGNATGITSKLDAKGKSIDSIQELPFDYLGVQVELEAKAKKENTFGTQFRKLFESNIFDSGVHQIPELAELHKEYVGLIKNLSELEWNKLSEELEVETKPDGSFKSMNVQKLVDVLQAEGKSRQLADNLIDSLQVDEKTGKLKYPIDSLVNRVKLESLMISLVNSRVVRQKMPGTAAVQLATTGFEKKGKRKVGSSNDLKSYRKENPKDPNSKTLPMQVKVPLTKDGQFKDLLKKYKTVEAVNAAIKEEGFDKRLLTMVGYRIPTQGLNSIDFLEVVEFLPDTHGDAIIMPSEIVAKSGGDFDIDKLNIFRPNFKAKSKLGIISKSEYISKALGIPYTEDQVNELVEEGTKDIVALSNAYEKEYYDGAELDFEYASGNSKQAMQNRIIEISKTILEHPYMFEQLITPNTTRDMDSIVSQVRYAEYKKTTENPVSFDEYVKTLEKKTPSTTQEMMFGHILNQFEYFLGGKSSVGTDAVNITAHVLFQQAAIKLDRFGKKDGKTVDKVKLNIDVNGDSEKIDLSAILNKNGKVISDIQSQIANLHLDAAKDPKYKDINLTKELLPVVHFLLHTGASEDTIIYLIKQPIIVDLILAERESILDSVGGKKKLDREAKTKKFLLDTKKRLGYKKDKNYVDKIFSKEDNTDLLAYISGEKEANKNLQIQILEDFIRYRKYAQELTSFSKLVNYDTNKFKDLAAIDDRMKGVAKLTSGKGIFNSSHYNSIMNNTIVGAFDKTEQTSQMFSSLFTTESPNFKSLRDEMMEEISPKGEFREKLPNIINNDFINYLTQRFGEVDGEVLSEKIYDLFFDKDDNLARRLVAIKKKIGKNVLLDEMQALISSEETEPNNITMYSRKLQKHEADTLTGAFRELLEYQGDDMEEIQKFAKDLVTFGILQSGLHNSPITFLGQIPFDYYGDITKEAIEAYESLEPEEQATVLRDFEFRFYLKNIGNDAIVPRIQDNDDGYEDMSDSKKFMKIYNRDTKSYKLSLNGKQIFKDKLLKNYGYRLQEFYLGDIEGDLDSGGITTKPVDEGDSTHSPEVIARVSSLLEEGYPVEDIIKQNLNEGLSEQELKGLAEELTQENDSELDETLDDLYTRLSKEYEIDKVKFYEAYTGAEAIGMSFEEFKESTEEQLKTCGKL